MANEISRFWNSTSPGDAGPFTFQQMSEVLQFAAGYAGEGATGANDSVLLGSGDGNNPPLAVLPASPSGVNVRVALGRALVQGAFYVNSAVQVLTLAANASGSPRIDTIILRVDYVAQTIRLAVKQGTPAGSPVRPTLVQSAGVTWEVPLADVAVANGFTTTVAADITSYPLYANLRPVSAHDGVLNTQGAELKTGDVAVWDTVTGGASAKKTTTASDPKVAGVWVGLSASNARGRLIYSGLAWVNVSAATAIGDQLVTSTVAGSAKKAASGEKFILGYALSATAGAGQVLAFIGIVPVAANFHSGISLTRSSALALTGSFADLVWNSEVYDTDNYWSSGASITIPVSGRYSFTGNIIHGGSPGASGSLEVQLQINGALITTYAAFTGTAISISWTAALTAGDTVLFRVRATSSGAGSATGGAQLELLTS